LGLRKKPYLLLCCLLALLPPLHRSARFPTLLLCPFGPAGSSRGRSFDLSSSDDFYCDSDSVNREIVIPLKRVSTNVYLNGIVKNTRNQKELSGRVSPPFSLFRSWGVSQEHTLRRISLLSQQQRLRRSELCRCSLPRSLRPLWRRRLS